MSEGHTETSMANGTSPFKEWLRKALDDNDPRSQFLVGCSLYCGHNGAPEQNYQKGTEWIYRAAENGGVDAQYDLGECFYYGFANPSITKTKGRRDKLENRQCDSDYRGIEKDYQKAVDWFQLAADQGHTEAMMDAGRCFQTGGPNLRQDLNQALYWFEFAEQHGHTEAPYQISIVFEAMEMFELAKDVEESNADAQYHMGISCQNTEQRLEWFEKAAAQGHAGAQKKVKELQSSHSP